MKINWIYLKICLLVVLSCNVLQAQDNGTYIDSAMISVPGTGGTTQESLDFITPCSSFYVQEGKAWIKVDLGENYELGNANFGIPFQITMDLDLTILTANPAVNPSISFPVTLDNNQPESIIYVDLGQYIDKDNNSTGFSYLGEQVTGVQGTVRNVTNNATAINTASDMRVKLNYEINYGIDVSTETVSNLQHNLIANSKTAVFQWENTCDAPGYEFQILRLYNTDPATTNDERVITTSIDWSKALSLFVETSQTSIDLTLGEGQGYYVWRVRPIGTFYENSIGNDKNWGAWNTIDYPSCTTCLFDTSLVSTQVFFFEDPDDNRNFQYSRVFTEDNKVSEQVTYATSLNQVRQTQRYIPSKDYKVVTQTILDNSGRPTLNTLPVPVPGERINQYKENFVTASGSLYTADNFDQVDNYNNPAMIDATGAFEYYSGANADKRIADAEGYPFTRVLFSNDGTDRVVEQSGVGKTHRLGGGRSTRTLYTTPTSDELVKLFGDEAPNHEDVAKIITIDPNNTRSVSYITKEGNTIATGLTFSEDSEVLDNVKDTDPDNTITGVTDRITNNVKTTNGFMSSKRITILEDNTEINISYVIAQQILDGLCNDLTFDLDYSLKIEIFDVASGQVVETFEQTTLKDLTDNTDDGIDNITVDFGAIRLNTGTYYVQKTLIPSEDIKLEVINAEDSLNKIIKPFFDWVIRFSNKVDCEEEMQYLYNDIFHFGKLVFDEQLAAGEITTLPNGERRLNVNFDCENCSQEFYPLKGKNLDDDEADDEFLDYYIGRESQYNLTIFYFDASGDLQPIDYSTTTELGSIKPVKISFSTPCCSFSVPIVFTPPFRTPSAEALAEYQAGFNTEGNVSLVDQVLESNTYYGTGLDPLTTHDETENWVHPNANFLYDDTKNFTYKENKDDNTVELENTKAYPIDFEGYAISMLYECKVGGEPGYTREDAAEQVYSYMRGWHRPGLLNRMVYHMVMDNYGNQECPRDDESTVNNTNRNSLYEVCDYEQPKVFLPGAAYSAQELAECWEPIVIEMVNRLCISAYGLDDDASGNVADSYDERGGDSRGHLSDNIKNFIIRWISKPKLIRRMRRMNVNGGDGAAADQATEEVEHMVNMFLQCTGYSFGDIVPRLTDADDKLVKPATNFEVFNGDFATRTNSLTNEEFTLYDRNRLAYPSIENADGNIDWIGFSIDPVEDGDYQRPTQEEIDNEVPENQYYGRIAEFFPYIKDPVFAFKYFEYTDGAFPILEGETCYRDPNMCIDDETGEEFPCCSDDNGNPIPCNFCDVGYITCEETKDDWNCEQRFTFYGLLKNYQEEAVLSIAPVNCENYYEATSYVENPDYGKLPEDGVPYELTFIDPNIPQGSLTDLEYLSVNLFTEYDAEGGYITNPLSSMTPVTHFKNLLGETPGDGVSIVENDAFEMMDTCKKNCADREGEFKQALIRIFEERCYEIADCKIEPNDNIVPEADIDALVQEIILQCENQCEIDTYACVDESCRLLGAPTRVDRNDPLQIEKFTLDLSFTDLGVSGPVVHPLSERQTEEGEASQRLNYFNPITGETTLTDATVLIEEKSTTGLKKYSFNDSRYPFVSIWDIRQSLTYAQKTRWSQAMEWKVKLDLPSKCDENGNYNPDLTYNDQNLPNEPVYVNNGDGWVVQEFAICTHQDDYVNRENEDGPGDTFVERDEYVSTTRAVYGSRGIDTGLDTDTDEYVSTDQVFRKNITFTNAGPEILEEVRLTISYETASDVKELYILIDGEEILLSPFTVRVGQEVQLYTYRIRDFSRIGNRNSILEVGEQLQLIKVVSVVEEAPEIIEYENQVSPVLSPKVGIYKEIDPANPND